MSSLAADEPAFLFRCAALPDDSLRVYRFSGREALNQPVEFKIELVSADANLDLGAPIGEPAHLILRGQQPSGERYTRYVHGVIERAVQVLAGPRYSVYEVTLVSSIGKLAHGQDSRIFQQRSAPAVILSVLAEAHIAVQPLLHASYGERDYCVQYQESSLQFVQRLCEQEGICTFFDHQADREVLILGDGAHAFSALDHASALRHRDEPHLYEEGLWELREQSTLRPGKAVLRDFRFQQPSLGMEATAESPEPSDYCMYYFPGDYVEPALGQRLARLRLEEKFCGTRRFFGRSNVRALMPGYKFTLDGHRRRACNQEYFIVAVHHTGVQPQAVPQGLAHERRGRDEPVPVADRLVYENQVECIPASVVFRPARLTPRPQVIGVQTAVVVGPAGEEIHCDEYGRVKVQFHWDRTGTHDDHSSCWIRVSQPFSGVGYGALFIPRVGHEVIVQFLHGDPDRPLVIGRVHNGENPLPYALPAAKTISTLRSASTPGGVGFNELRFDDHTGHELVHLRAQSDFSLHVGHNANSHIHADECCRIEGNRSVLVKRNLGTLVENGDHTLKVKSGGSLTQIKGQSKTEVATGNSELWVLSGSHTTKAEGPVTIESGQGKLSLFSHGPWHGKSQEKASIEAPEITIRAQKKLTLTVGQNSITLDESGIEIDGTQITSSATGNHVISGALVSIN